ncbi:hypothetical protein GCM10020254_57430 [Streptomyces goshikiensis]
MKAAGPCQCPAPCHGWAAATTDQAVLASPAWARAWQQAQAIAYHPGGARLTVVDLDNAEAIAWAREALPLTKVVATTRGEHWVYRGAMQSPPTGSGPAWTSSRPWPTPAGTAPAPGPSPLCRTPSRRWL